ncbi:MAG TPA: tungsten ABC transporter substrate-binding protein [Myxococcales bacterium]|nr:tungsten ABC transporter substrate-binding protein [Myxococcales bacterium]
MRKALCLLMLLAACTRSQPEQRAVVLATTTSFQDSGLLDELVTRFRAAGGPPIKAIAVGTGEALAMGERGDADVLVVHAPEAEEAFVKAGHGVNRRALWHNDFLLVGPPSDPAGLRDLKTAAEALGKLAGAKAGFASRGDDSGTHKKEKALLKLAEIDPWEGYLSVGQGMGETLRIASEKALYTLTDRGTWLTLRSTLALEPLVQGDPPLDNPYHVIEVNPARHAQANQAGARRFADFLVSPEIQSFVARFGEETLGQPLFIPDAAGGTGVAGR